MVVCSLAKGVEVLAWIALGDLMTVMEKRGEPFAWRAGDSGFFWLGK